MIKQVIGHFHDTRNAFEAAFYRHAYNVTKYEQNADIDDSRHFEITIGNVVHAYYLTTRDNWKQAIAGIQFQAIYVDVASNEDKFWISTRFRPQ